MHHPTYGRTPGVARRAIIPGLLLCVASSTVASAGAINARWSQLAPYPTTITNNAVTSVCDDGGCTIYSFMGMTSPNTQGSVTAASYKLAPPANFLSGRRSSKNLRIVRKTASYPAEERFFAAASLTVGGDGIRWT